MYDKTKLLELFEKMDSIHLNIDDLQELIEYFTESLENNFMIDRAPINSSSIQQETERTQQTNDIIQYEILEDITNHLG